jgi:hypothetical protein
MSIDRVLASAQPHSKVVNSISFAVGKLYDSGDFEGVMDKALALADWNSFAIRKKRAGSTVDCVGSASPASSNVGGSWHEQPRPLYRRPAYPARRGNPIAWAGTLEQRSRRWSR